MERILIIKDFLGLVALTKSEKLQLIKELMSEWHLTESDVTVSPAPAHDTSAENTENAPSEQNNETETAPSEETAQEAASPAPEPPATKRKDRKKKTEEETASQDDVPPVSAPPVTKRRGRPKKAKPENIPLETVSPIPAPPAETPKKRRGRPPKARIDGNTAEDADKEPDMSSGTLSKEDAALIEKAAESKNIRDLLDDEPEIPSKTSRKRNPAFCYLADFPALKPFIIGQEYSFEFLYQWKNKNLLSPHVLSDLSPVGIYIPYKNLVFGKYRGFIVSIYDEHVADNAADAEKTAQTMPPIDDEFWTIMDSLQWSVLKTYIGVVNRMLAKIGGDAVKNQYRTCSPKSNMICGLGGFRYTISVK